MPTYVSLLKFTDQARKNIKDVFNRRKEVLAALERSGGRLIAFYLTQGAYDGVSILEFPDEDSAMAALLGAATRGNVTTETMRAFSDADMERILKKLP